MERSTHRHTHSPNDTDWTTQRRDVEAQSIDRWWQRTFHSQLILQCFHTPRRKYIKRKKAELKKNCNRYKNRYVLCACASVRVSCDRWRATFFASIKCFLLLSFVGCLSVLFEQHLCTNAINQSVCMSGLPFRCYSRLFSSLSLVFISSFLSDCFLCKKGRRINRRLSWKFSFKVWNWNSSVNFANKTKKREHTRNKRFTKRWCIQNRRAPKDVNTQL